MIYGHLKFFDTNFCVVIENLSSKILEKLLDN